MACALLSIKMRYNFSSFILRQEKERANNSFSMGLSYICCAIRRKPLVVVGVNHYSPAGAPCTEREEGKGKKKKGACMAKDFEFR